MALGLTNELTCPSRPLLRNASADGVPCRGDSPRLEEVHVGQAGRGRKLRCLLAPLRPHKSGPARGGRGPLLSCLGGWSRGVTGARMGWRHSTIFLVNTNPTEGHTGSGGLGAVLYADLGGGGLAGRQLMYGTGPPRDGVESRHQCELHSPSKSLGRQMLRRRKEKHAKQGDSMGGAGHSTTWMGRMGSKEHRR